MLRTLRVVLVALLAVACPVNVRAGGPAPPPPNVETGRQGLHVLIDNDDFPGARCVYNDAAPQVMVSVRVRAPIVYAVDRSTGTDRQTVGWRYRIWTNPDPNNNAWVLLATGPIQKRGATDRNNAPFSSQTYAVPPGHTSEIFFVQVSVRWFAPHSASVDGTADTGVQSYYNQTVFSDYITHNSCSGAAT